MKHRLSKLSALCAGIALLVQPAVANAQRTINLPGQDRALAGSPEVAFRVGVEDGDPNEVFSAVAAVSFDGAGNLYVLDRDNGRIVVFDRTGKFVRTVGSKGQGPGELGFPVGLAVFPDGRLAVMDVASSGITVFGSDGQYSDFVSPDRRYVQPRLSMLLVPTTNDGLLMAGGQVSSSPNAPPQVSDSLPIVRVGLDGDTRVVHRTFNKGPVLSVSGGPDEQRVALTPPPVFTPQVSWAALPNGGLAISPGLQYEVRVVSPAGEVDAVLTRPVRPRDVSNRDRDAAREQARETMESGAGGLRVEESNGRRTISAGGQAVPRQQIEQRLAAMQFAEQVPVVRGLRVDNAGNIWVQRDGGPGSDDYPIDILTPAGEYRGTIRGIDLPNAFGPSGLAAFIETDDLGIQRVVVRRMPDSLR